LRVEKCGLIEDLDLISLTIEVATYMLN
jgi:hypothetical protein